MIPFATKRCFTVLGLCFGFSLLAAKLGYSVALGAFIIGAVIAESREIHRIEILTEPIRDMFRSPSNFNYQT